VWAKMPLTTFIGHHHQTDHTRRQIRRYRGKVDDVVDVVSTDGYLVRMKPLIITQQRVQTSVKQDMRSSNPRHHCRVCTAKKHLCTGVQTRICSTESLRKKSKRVSNPSTRCALSPSARANSLQDGVVPSDGPTLDEIHSKEQREAAEHKAKKAAALAAAMAEEEAEMSGEDADVSDEEEDASEEVAPAVEEAAPAAEPAEPAPEPASDAPDYSSMTVAELKELLKAAGKPVSGKKADLIARLHE